MAANFQQVGEQFCQHYYQLFDANRSTLGPLYGDTSMLTFEGEQFQGSQGIVGKLASLPFQKVQHQVVKCDCQPAPPGGVLIFVTGNLLVDDNTSPLKFAQTFLLMQGPTGNYFCQNDMFRLNIG
mmetsp:Transcript_44443/g.128644  ORF Transcript_44443/g.128644 Transcript_44443/m.128644 type:complete len:125 (-) Transcript_44443:135-509(-)